MIWPLSSKETQTVRGKLAVEPGSPQIIYDLLWLWSAAPWGPQGCLDSSLTHSSQQLFQTQSYLSKTLTLTPMPHSQEVTSTPTQQEKQKPLRVTSFNLLTSRVCRVLFLFSSHFYQPTKIAVTSAAHGLTFSHSLIWPRHNLILKRAFSILKKYSYCYLFTHWLVWILHFSQTTLVIYILGILPGCFPLFVY